MDALLEPAPDFLNVFNFHVEYLRPKQMSPLQYFLLDATNLLELYSYCFGAKWKAEAESGKAFTKSCNILRTNPKLKSRH